MRIQERSREEAAAPSHIVRPRPSGLPPVASDFSIWKAILRRWWVVVIFALLGGLAGIAYSNAQPTDYQAQSVVVATKSRIPREDISSVLETVFPTDPIMESVISDLNLSTTPQGLLSKGRLSADSETGGSLVITALDSSPQLALDIANSAADNFAEVANTEGLGTYAVLGARETSATDSGVARQLTTIGVGLGALAGAALVFALYFLKQPVLSEREAVRELVSDASLAAHVRIPLLPTVTPESQRSLGRSPKVTPKEIGAATLRAATDGSDLPVRVCCVVMERTRRTRRPDRIRGWTKSSRARGLLLAEMGAEPYSEERSLSPEGIDLFWISSKDDRLSEAVVESEGVIVMVPAGSRRPSLQLIAEELFASANSKRRVALFVTVSRTLL